jgi:nucleoside-diphosphate-sugar epimerase
VLDYCRGEKAKLIYLSTYVYGRPRYLPIDEEHPAQPLNPYTHSKWLGEEICRFYVSHMNVPVTIVRPFNLYGPEQSDRFLVAHMVKQWRAGGEISINDVRPRRDYLYIDDFIEACTVLHGLAERAPIYNVGSGTSVSVGDVLTTMQEVVGAPVPWRSRELVRQDEIGDIIASCRLTRQDLWKPRIDMREGIRRMIAAR